MLSGLSPEAEGPSGWSPAPSERANIAEPRVLLTSLARLFNEGVMGFLALVALATAVGPMVFDVTPAVERALTVIEWVLVSAFAAEFLISGAVAPSFRAWIRSPCASSMWSPFWGRSRLSFHRSRMLPADL